MINYEWKQTQNQKKKKVPPFAEEKKRCYLSFWKWFYVSFVFKIMILIR